MNNKDAFKRESLEKPCYILKYCPYGSSVADFELSTNRSYACKVFSCDCPVYHLAQPVREEN